MRSLEPRPPSLDLDRVDTPAGATLTASIGADERYEALDLSGLSLAGAAARDTEFLDCVLPAGDATGVQLSGASITGSRWDAPRAAELPAANARWTNTEVNEPRFGAADLHGSVWDRVAVTGGKIDHVNLRGATITDVAISGTVIGEIDLGEATVRRMNLTDCRIGRLNVAHATLHRLDLRSADLGEVDSLAGLAGSVIGDRQLTDLAPAMAAYLGIEVVTE